MNLTAGSIRLFRIAGIDIYLHWSWFLVAVLQVANRADVYHNDAWKVAEYLSWFALVLLHEFGHVLACRSVGGRADQIVLWPLGGVAYVAPPPRPGAVLWSIAAGPLVNLILVAVSIVLYVAFPEQINLMNAVAGAREVPDLYRFLSVLVVFNLGMLLFNLVPIYPLDGGQIVQSLLWFVVGRWRSLMYVSLVGMGFGGLLFFASLPLGIATGPSGFSSLSSPGSSSSARSWLSSNAGPCCYCATCRDMRSANVRTAAWGRPRGRSGCASTATRASTCSTCAASARPAAPGISSPIARTAGTPTTSTNGTSKRRPSRQRPRAVLLLRLSPRRVDQGNEGEILMGPRDIADLLHRRNLFGLSESPRLGAQPPRSAIPRW